MNAETLKNYDETGGRITSLVEQRNHILAVVESTQNDQARAEKKLADLRQQYANVEASAALSGEQTPALKHRKEIESTKTEIEGLGARLEGLQQVLTQNEDELLMAWNGFAAIDRAWRLELLQDAALEFRAAVAIMRPAAAKVQAVAIALSDGRALEALRGIVVPDPAHMTENLFRPLEEQGYVGSVSQTIFAARQDDAARSVLESLMAKREAFEQIALLVEGVKAARGTNSQGPAVTPRREMVTVLPGTGESQQGMWLPKKSDGPTITYPDAPERRRIQYPVQ